MRKRNHHIDENASNKFKKCDADQADGGSGVNCIKFHLSPADMWHLFSAHVVL